jgi:hypothetical protein|tara:strand:+ start:21 stop:890 length:870 start_codon:yes stop_codon:yes gene_type:complete
MQKRFGDLFSESWEEYKSKFKLLLKTYSWLYIIPQLIILVLSITLAVQMIQLGVIDVPDLGADKMDFGMTGNAVDDAKGELTDLQNLKIILSEFFPIILAIIVLSLISYLFLSLSLFYMAFYDKKNNLSFKQVFTNSLSYFWVYLGLSFLVIIALIPLFLLLIIPGLIFLVYWYFSSYVLVGENKGIIESMKTSMNVVRGRWWSVFGYMLLFMLIIMAISIVISIPFSLISFALSLGAIFSESGLILMVAIDPFIDFFSNLIVSFITVPLTILFFKNYYLNLKANPIAK